MVMPEPLPTPLPAAPEGPATTASAALAVGRRSGITIRSFSCALECKLQTVECLTLVGTEGLSGFLPCQTSAAALQHFAF